MEHHALQPLKTRGQRNLAILIPEKTRVAQPGRENPPVARRDQGAPVGRVYIGDAEKMRREPRLPGSADSEIALVNAHDGPRHLRREVEEGGIHVAQDRRRPLDHAGHLIQKAGVLHQFESAGGHQGPRARQNSLFAVPSVQNDEMLFETRAIVREVSHVEGTGAAHEAVTRGQGAGRETFDLKWRDLAVKEADEAANQE